MWIIQEICPGPETDPQPPIDCTDPTNFESAECVTAPPVGNDGNGGGTGGGDGGNNIGTQMPPPPDIPIADMKKFLSCLDANSPANLTVYVEKVFNSFPGHAFISIAQGGNTMVFGFYPKNNFPGTLTGPGIMGDNGGHAYNAAWNIGSVSAEILQQIISVSVNYSLSDYGLAANNCADFTLDVLRVAGITNSASGIDSPDTIFNLMPESAKTTGSASQTHRTCN
jgi:hypothetical protein